MSLTKILIVEDEILIADNIKRFLTKKGYDVVGIAISYEEAVQLYEQKNPDISLVDIRLNGIKSGIDFADFLQVQKKSKPFIYLTSQFDRKNIQRAKQTYPAAYLPKPVHKESLSVAIEMALFKYSKGETGKHPVVTIPVENKRDRGV